MILTTNLIKTIDLMIYPKTTSLILIQLLILILFRFYGDTSHGRTNFNSLDKQPTILPALFLTVTTNLYFP